MKVTIGLSLSLSGAFAPIGRQAEDALRLFVADINAAGGVNLAGEQAELALRCHDDRSDRTRCAGIYRELCASPGVDVLLGPYSSELTAVAAPIAEEAGRLFVNHGGASDELYSHGYRMIVGLQTPASGYFDHFVRLLASLKFWRKRVALVTEPTQFAHAIMSGFDKSAATREMRRGGVRVRLKWDDSFGPGDAPKLLDALKRKRVNAVVSAGSYGHDVSVMRAILRSGSNVPVLACVAAGLSRFRDDLGDRVEGIVGTSQWEPNFQAIPELGPDPREFTHRMKTQTRSGECDYIAAQAYAAGLLVSAVLNKVGAVDQARMREQFSSLRTGTLFGAFAIDPETGRQVAHRMVTIQWHQGRKLSIEPHPRQIRGPLEFAPGVRLFTAGLRALHLMSPRKMPATDFADED